MRAVSTEERGARAAITRVGIVNRGEPAARFLATVETLHAADDALTAVALYTDADAGADWIARADDAARIGIGRAAYLDAGAVVEALRRSGCDAAWLGWGFASEDGAFAAAIEGAGITLLGPRPETMTALGDKIRAKRLAEAHAVPVAPWAVVDDAADAAREAERIGFPLLIKAAGGGGGRGIRRVDAAAEVPAAFAAARDEAARSFGGGGVFLERLVRRARHVEVQVLGDGDGAVRVFGVRDCSLQRRRQKVIEECPGPALPDAIARGVAASAERLCAAVRYRGVGTVEFLYDLDARQAWFLEVNTRLQVEHTVTEAVYGVDLVKAQIDVARGRPLPAVGPAHGHAVEARICAEDVRRDFTPAPGRLVRFAVPTGPGLRVDTGFVEGEDISADFDPLVAKLIAWGPDRRTAFARLEAALGRARIVVEGGATNLVFLRDLARLPSVRAGEVHIGLVDDWRRAPAEGRGIALLAAAIDRFLAAGDRAGGPERHRVEAGEPLRVYRLGPERFRVTGGDGAVTVRYAADGPFEHRLTIGGTTWRVERAEGDTRYLVDGEPHGVPAARGGAIAAPSAALVLDTAVRVGESVRAGEAVAVLESMKMEVRVEAPCAGTVREVCIGPGDQVAAGQLLVVVEPRGGDRARVESPIPWQRQADCPAERVRAALVGWDAEPAALLADAGRLSPAECAPLLAVFADIAALFDRRPGAEAGPAISADVWFDTVEQRGVDRLSADRAARLEQALTHHGAALDAGAEALADPLLRLRRVGAGLDPIRRVAQALLARLESVAGEAADGLDVRLLDRLAGLDPARFPRVVDAARRLRIMQVEHPARARLLAHALTEARRLLGVLRGADVPNWGPVHAASESLVPGFAPTAALEGCSLAAEAVARRLEWREGGPDPERITLGARPAFAFGHGAERVLCVTARPAEVPESIASARHLDGCGRLDLVLVSPEGASTVDRTLGGLVEALARPCEPPPCDLCLVMVAPGRTAVRWIGRDGVERWARRDILPSSARRLDLDRLAGFDLERLDSPPDVVLLRAQHKTVREDVRLLAYGEIRSLERSRGVPLRLNHVERVFHGAVRAMDEALTALDPRRRLQWNRITLRFVPPVPRAQEIIDAYVERLAPSAERIGLEKVVLRARFVEPDADPARAPLRELVITPRPGGRGLDVAEPRDPSRAPLAPLDPYQLQLVVARRRRLVPPDELVTLLRAEGMPPCRFEPWALDGDVPAPAPQRGRGEHPAGVVFGIARGEPYVDERGRPRRTPDRVLLMSDPTRSMGSLAEPECRRIIAAIDLAEREALPLEWIAVSAGARIDWQSGTENLDWTAAALRRIVRFTQAGGEINVLVPGICVGAQSYFNAEATMMMHTRGVLVMTDRGSMVLTGKRALDASGCVSADDDLSLGGYTAIMGPNGQAQAHAADLESAWALLYRYYALTWVAPGARRPARLRSDDPVDRDIGDSPYPAALGHGFERVGEIFSAAHNPDRKRPFAVRPVMGALVDADQPPLERWAAMHEAETVVVWEARIGGCAATVIGVDNQPLGRLGRPDPAGPEQFAGGTLYPQGARKVARALNAASGRRPAVVLANLSGFDGSPESLRRWQLEYGAEIGRAVVNFDGPIAFVVLSRYHGGAYVVFSKRLNPQLTALALDGSYASVIGGAPAAAVVFAGEVRKRAAALGGDTSARLKATAELAARFDGIHTVERAQAVGSIDRIVDPSRLRPAIVELLLADLAEPSPAS